MTKESTKRKLLFSSRFGECVHSKTAALSCKSSADKRVTHDKRRIVFFIPSIRTTYSCKWPCSSVEKKVQKNIYSIPAITHDDCQSADIYLACTSNIAYYTLALYYRWCARPSFSLKVACILKRAEKVYFSFLIQQLETQKPQIRTSSMLQSFFVAF